MLLDVSSEEAVPVEKLLLDAYLPLWKDFAAKSIRLDDTLSKVDKLVQLAESKNQSMPNEEKILKFFEKDIQVKRI